jgi:lipoprotein-anchoring transpeptidase ErfK/SrfK
MAVLAVAGSLTTADAGLFKRKLPPVDYVDDDLSNLPPLKGENQIAQQWRRTPVFYRSPYPPGTIVVDTSDRYLYLIVGQGKAIRYGVAVGREGYTWEGQMKVTKKAEWPDWRPPADMIAREKKKGKTLPAVVPGGPGNPLGARALYLGGTVYRIHGTNQPRTIGYAVSSGCFRLVNRDVIDLYERVPVGTKVVVRQAAQP